MSFWQDREKKAASQLEALVALPVPTDECDTFQDGFFNPWSLFPAIYGTYCSSFDKCAVDVLKELLVREKVRRDLGAEMFREMLCAADFCEYGSSPRVCFSNPGLEKVLSVLIEKWKAWALLNWGEGWEQE